MTDQTRDGEPPGATKAAAEADTPGEAAPEPDTASRLSRREFVLGLMAVLGGIAAALVAVPAAAFMSAPGWLSTLPRRLLSETVSPALRSEEWTSAGAVDDFREGIPKHVIVDRPIVDGWVQREEPVGVFVLRESDTRATVMDPHCTHLGCPIDYSTGARSFLCPCHGGAFDAVGRPTAGPPPRPLDRYETKVEDGQILFRELLESKA